MWAHSPSWSGRLKIPQGGNLIQRNGEAWGRGREGKAKLPAPPQCLHLRPGCEHAPEPGMSSGKQPCGDSAGGLAVARGLLQPPLLPPPAGSPFAPAPQSTFPPQTSQAGLFRASGTCPGSELPRLAAGSTVPITVASATAHSLFSMTPWNHLVHFRVHLPLGHASGYPGACNVRHACSPSKVFSDK